MEPDLTILKNKEYNKEYRTKNIENIRKREIEYRTKNKQLLRDKASSYAKKIRAEKGEAYEKLKARKKAFAEKNKEKIAESLKKYRELNKDAISEKRKMKYKSLEGKHKPLTESQRIAKNARNCAYSKRMREEGKLTPFMKFKMSLRRRINYAFTRIKMSKPYKSEVLIGINLYECMIYIESKFKDGMSWENRNLWHVDHIIPLASAKTEEDAIKLCHYTNLQPLWAKENMTKGSKILTNKI